MLRGFSWQNWINLALIAFHSKNEVKSWRTRLGLSGQFARNPAMISNSRRTNLHLSLAGHLETLEIRSLLSSGPIASGATVGTSGTNANVSHPDFILSQAVPFATSSPTGLTPTQMRQAYGMTNIQFGTVVGDGTGQTIAIVDAYDDPNAQADLKAFDTYFGLVDPPSFTILNQNGQASPKPSPSSNGWSIEESLDFEWAHVMAPKANLVLFEANSNFNSDLYAAVNTAKAYPGVSAVSMSFGTYGDFSGETSYDSTFLTPTGHQGVTFIAATGDNGAPGGYPAYSPNVVAVGGTTLTLNGGGGYGSESGWSGSGGGISTMESEPAFQNSVQKTGSRTIPDVSMDADPNSGVPVYDSYDFGAVTPWAQYGGTSLATPLFAGIIAVVNQERVLNGQTTLDGSTGTLPAIYQLPKTDFHDITTGYNGYSAGVGYDYVTGIGSPVPDHQFVQDLSPIITVTNTNDSGTGSLRAAIAIANAGVSGETIKFASNLAGGTIHLTSGQLQITNSMAITGLGANQLTIDGGWDGVLGDSVGSRIFNVSSGTNVVISGLTLTHGIVTSLGGGAIINSGNLRLDHDTITGNLAIKISGGGVQNNGSLNSTNCTISGNVSYYGGGVYNNSVSATWNSTNDTISANQATQGGAMYNLGKWVSTNDTITANSTSSWNLGIYSSINTINSGNSGTDLSGIKISNTTTSNLIGGNVAQILATDSNGIPVLANNGGATQTVALIAGSPAIGGAVPLATLSQILVAGAATFTVNSGTFLAVGQLLQIEGEIVTVTATNGTTITVTRATGGGTNHAAGASINLAYDQTDALRTMFDIGAVEEFGPAITTQPTNQAVPLGTQATFTTAAVGNPTPTVQWQFSSDGGTTYSNISGATSTTLNVTTTSAMDGYLYRAIFNNIVGSATTNFAALTVEIRPVIIWQPTDQTVVSGNVATFTAVAFGTPAPTVQWQISINGGASYTDIPGATSATLNVTTSTSQNGYLYRAVFTNVVGSATTKSVKLTVVYAPTITTQPNNQLFVLGSQATFTAAAVGNPAPTLQWQFSADGGSTFSNIVGASSTTLIVNMTTAQYGYQYRAVFSNSVGSATTNTVGLLSSPAISTQPTNQTVVAGNLMTLTAAAIGDPVPSVQWQYSPDGGKIFINIASATSTTLNVVTSAVQNGYLYRAVFTNAYGRVTTNAVMLTVLTAPLITTQPANQTVGASNQVTFTAAASGNPAPTVQWQFSADGGTIFANIVGATSNTLKLTTTSNQVGYLYRAVFTNSVGSVVTNTVTWTPQTAPKITTQPASQTVVAGGQATFTASASGNPAPSVQWQLSTNGGTSYTNIPGANLTTLIVAVTAKNNRYLYQAIFTNAAGSAVTNPALLTVQTAPTITTQPTSQTVLAGTQVTFTAAASGNPTPTVQWQVSIDGGKTYTDIVGATSTALSVTASAKNNGNFYRAIFTNAIGSAVTASVKLTVH